MNLKHNLGLNNVDNVDCLDYADIKRVQSMIPDGSQHQVNFLNLLYYQFFDLRSEQNRKVYDGLFQDLKSDKHYINKNYH